jgi:TPR repeat protein
LKNLTLTISLILVILLGSAGTSWGADFGKGVVAYNNGDFETALQELIPLTEQRDAFAHKITAFAQFYMGLMYQNGEGVPQDYETAIKWFTLAAEQGIANAQFNLGQIYRKGEGVPQDYETAIKWFTLAAGQSTDFTTVLQEWGPSTSSEFEEQGSVNAQNALGEMYRNGEGVSQDYETAIKWYFSAAARSSDFTIALKEFTRLAEKGNADAQFYLGFMYRNGEGVPNEDSEDSLVIYGVPYDDETAFKWYTLAAEQGHSDAQVAVGYMYRSGLGVPQGPVEHHYETAIKWFTLAAEQGDVVAQFNLGQIYGDGEGVPQDYVYGHMWFDIAASNGIEIGGWLRDELAKDMTSSQIEKAQELARECVRKKYKGC